MPHAHLRLVRPDEEALVFGWMDAAWPHPKGREAGLAHRRQWAAHPWAQDHLQRWCWEVDGRPQSACAVYDLRALAHGRSVRLRGFGSVVTPPEARGQGFAKAMLAALLAPDLRHLGGPEQPAEAALLYTDIGTAYYAALGFAPAELLRAWAPALAARAGEWRPEGPADRSAREARRRVWQAVQALALDRVGPEAEAFWAERGEWEAWAWAPDGGPAQGHAWCHPGEGRLHVGEAIAEPGTPEGLWQQALRGLAAAHARPEVGQWCCGQAPGGWQAAPMPKGYPMLAGLGGAPTPSVAGPFFPFDYF